VHSRFRFFAVLGAGGLAPITGKTRFRQGAHKVGEHMKEYGEEKGVGRHMLQRCDASEFAHRFCYSHSSVHYMQLSELSRFLLFTHLLLRSIVGTGISSCEGGGQE
jgi:hypothetical protein